MTITQHTIDKIRRINGDGSTPGGRNGSHQKMLDYVMGRNGQSPPWKETGEKPPAVGKP